MQSVHQCSCNNAESESASILRIINGIYVYDGFVQFLYIFFASVYNAIHFASWLERWLRKIDRPDGSYLAALLMTVRPARARVAMVGCCSCDRDVGE